MKPWEISRTKKKMKKIGAGKTIRMFFDLHRSGIKILKASLMDQYPHLTEKQLKNKISRLAESIGRL